MSWGCLHLAHLTSPCTGQHRMCWAVASVPLLSAAANAAVLCSCRVIRPPYTDKLHAFCMLLKRKGTSVWYKKHESSFFTTFFLRNWTSERLIKINLFLAQESQLLQLPCDCFLIGIFSPFNSFSPAPRPLFPISEFCSNPAPGAGSGTTRAEVSTWAVYWKQLGVQSLRATT